MKGSIGINKGVGFPIHISCGSHMRYVASIEI